MLNKKLQYINKLFNGFSLSNKQKYKVIDSFDKAYSLKEAKLVFESLNKSLEKNKLNENRKKGNASKSIRSTKPTKQKINENKTNNSNNELDEEENKLYQKWYNLVQ